MLATVRVHSGRGIGAVVHDPDAPELSGEVHVDGLYTGKRTANRARRPPARGRIDGQAPGRGCGARDRRSQVPFVVSRESAAVALIRERVASGAIIHADESSAWDILHASYDTRRINRSVEYVAVVLPRTLARLS